MKVEGALSPGFSRRCIRRSTALQLAILISLNELLNPHEDECVCGWKSYIHIHAWMGFFCTPGTCLIKGRHSWEIIIKGFAETATVLSLRSISILASCFFFSIFFFFFLNRAPWLLFFIWKLQNLNNAQVAWTAGIHNEKAKDSDSSLIA